MDRRRTIALLLAWAAFALGAAACGGGGSSSNAGATETAATTSGESATASGELAGEVGPGFTIEVSQNGADVETIAAGTYTLTVEDKSSQHNFHLIGPGVDETVTDVPFTGEKTVTVALEPGTYTYQCDPHAASGMTGTFTVT